MDNIYDSLLEYARSSSSMFNKYHSRGRLEEIEKYISDNIEKDDKKYSNFRLNELPIKNDMHIEMKELFDIRLDANRLIKANDLSEYVLYISDMKDASYFREVLTRKEFSRTVYFDKQRDHAVHTFYNYVLGWFLFDHCCIVRDAFIDRFNDLCFDNELTENKKIIYIDKLKMSWDVDCNHFGDVWPFASLLHDIGYILEGGLSVVNPETEDVQIANGSKVIHDFFSHWFWRDMEIDFRTAKSVTETLKVWMPDFKHTRSVASLADYLCDVGSCENIRYGCAKLLDAEREHDLNVDAFRLWELHYQYLARQTNSQYTGNMCNILRAVNEEFKYDAWRGNQHGIRTLNHGVCSGLILLMSQTYFFELYSAVNKKFSMWANFKASQQASTARECTHISRKTYESIQDSILNKMIPPHTCIRDLYDDHWWAKKVLWGTAAACVHDVMQSELWPARYYTANYPDLSQQELSEKCKVGVEHKLSIFDDPLAYLGVLCDVVQEWDRYSVSGAKEFSGGVSIEGRNVKLNIDKRGKVILLFDNKNVVEKINETLSRCLLNYSDVLTIAVG